MYKLLVSTLSIFIVSAQPGQPPWRHLVNVRISRPPSRLQRIIFHSPLIIHTQTAKQCTDSECLTYPFALEEVEQRRDAVEPDCIKVVRYDVVGGRVRTRSKVVGDAAWVAVDDEICHIVVLVVDFACTTTPQHTMSTHDMTRR